MARGSVAPVLQEAGADGWDGPSRPCDLCIRGSFMNTRSSRASSFGGFYISLEYCMVLVLKRVFKDLVILYKLSIWGKRRNIA